MSPSIKVKHDVSTVPSPAVLLENKLLVNLNYFTYQKASWSSMSLKGKTIHLWGKSVLCKLFDISGPSVFTRCLLCQEVQHEMHLQDVGFGQEM